jgi:transposase
MNNTRVGVDLAKDVIQVCIYANNKVRSNKEMTQQEFSLWLINIKPGIIIFEACGTSNYWHQVATALGPDSYTQVFLDLLAACDLILSFD